MPNNQDYVPPNAADTKQVKKAGQRERSTREQQLNDMRDILAIDAGKRFLWRLMEHCKVNASVFSASAHIYYCLLYTSPSPRDLSTSRMPSSA